MGVYTEAVQKLYVAYFNRPADVAGLTFWEGVVAKANGSTAAVSAAFAASPEYKAAYAGMDEYHVVAQIYQNLFGHGPDKDGLNFWGQALINKQMTVDNAVTFIAAGALGSDKTAYANKVAAATAFTNALDTPEEILGYAGDAALNAAKTWVGGIATDDQLKAAIATDALNATVAQVVDLGTGSTGKSYTLTIGQDTLTGTSGSDTFTVNAFNATTGEAAKTLQGFDSIDGGAGKDTLNIDMAGVAATGTPTVKNVEIINITNAAAAVDASVFQGATNVNVSGTSTVNKLANGAVAGFDSTAGNITVTASGASVGVSLKNVAETSSITASGATLSTVTVTGTRADSNDSGSLTKQALNITAGKNVQAVTVTTNQSTVVTLTENADTTAAKQITSFDASASTGKIEIVGDADLATVKTGSGADKVTVNAYTAAATTTAAASNASVTTGAGNDEIIVNFGTQGTGADLVQSSGLTSVDAGAGNDSITVNKVASATVSVLGGEGNDKVTLTGAALSTKDVIDGGAGTDTISLAGQATARTADDFIVFNKLLKNFETIAFSSTEGSATVSFDASQLASNYTTVDLASGSYIAKVGSQALIANGALNVVASGYSVASSGTVTYAGTVGITEKATGTVTVNADVVNLAVTAADADVTATLAGDVRTATVALTNGEGENDDGDAIDTFASVIVTTSASAEKALASLTLTGNGTATVHNTGGKLATVDASALGGTLAFGDNAGAVTGGLNYDTSNAVVETIKLGSGTDTVRINAGGSLYGAVDTVTGLKLAVNAAGTALTATSDKLYVAGMTTAEKFTTTQTDIDLALKDAAASTKGNDLVFQLGGDTYVYHDGGTAGSVDAGDIVVKLTGTIDLDALILSIKAGAPA